MFAAAAAAAYCIASPDLSLSLCVDPATGAVASLTTRSLSLSNSTTSLATLLGASATRSGPPTVAQASPGAPITITQMWLAAPGSGAPPGAGARVVDTLSTGSAQGPSSIDWAVSIEGLVAAPWSLPIVTSASLGAGDVSRLKLWAPWDRGSATNFPRTFVDPLQPSDTLPAGWWDGCYRLGNGRGPEGCGDFVGTPLLTLLAADPALDAGVSLLLSPRDAPLDTTLNLRGTAGAWDFTRTHARLALGLRLELHLALAAHEGDWRAGMGWAARSFPEFFEPANPEAFAAVAGTGSYSWWLGNITSPSLGAMGYKTNWDLSGRFFPYMGMFLPPVAPGAVWLNDPQGTQARANVSFASIDAWYSEMAAAGFTDMSYLCVGAPSK